MEDQFIRTRMLLGQEALDRLARARVAVFGLGGVGGFAAEALVRSGVGALDLIDHDRVAASNLNRQIIALHSTVGGYKVDVARARFLDINPRAVIRTYPAFYLPGEADQFDFTQYDYVVDAIDTVTAKIGLALRAQEAGTPIISAMGTGNKLDPTALQVTDIYSTSVCPLARIMRKELRKRGVKALKVVYSQETPIAPLEQPEDEDGGVRHRQTPASSAFVPPAAGLIIASEIVRYLISSRIDK